MQPLGSSSKSDTKPSSSRARERDHNKHRKRRERATISEEKPLDETIGTRTMLPELQIKGAAREMGRTRERGGEKPQINSTGTSKSNHNPNAHPTLNNSNFEGGEDFIAFNISSSSEDEAGSTTGAKTKEKDRKGKGKEKEVISLEDEDDDKEPQTTDIRTGKTRVESAQNAERSQDKSKAIDSGPNSRRSDRDWDRGKESYDDRDRRGNRREKRQFDEHGDGYENKKQRLDAASRKCPWVQDIDFGSCFNVAEMMHREVEAFINWISPSPVEDEIRGLVVTQVSKVIKSAFPDASVHPFGSYETKLYLPLGDIDLVVLSDAMAYSDKSTVLHLLANMLKRHGITSHVTIIAKAKVPIVKFTTTHGRFKVDISINQGNGLVSGNIITGFLKNMIPRSDGAQSKALRSLVMITKAFLSQRSMNEVYTGGLGSYAVVCLAVSFLQMHPKIRRGEIDPERNLGVLAMEFFELYGTHFNYDEVGISLRNGGTYFNKRQRGWHAEYRRNMLSIEDPADPSNDISSGSYNFHKVRTAFAGCHSILTSTAYLRAGILSARRRGRSISLREEYRPEDLSILSTVMGITQETLNHRKLVQELYDRRVLHNIVGVKPLPVSIRAEDSDLRRTSLSSNDKAQASRAVEESWANDLDRSRDADDFDDHYKLNGRRKRGMHHADDDDDEQGRYHIGRQPPKKRRRTEKEKDERTVFVADDDEEGEGKDGEEREEGEEDEYMSDSSIEEIASFAAGDQSKRDSRRSYWLSKGLGFVGVGDSP